MDWNMKLFEEIARSLRLVKGVHQPEVFEPETPADREIRERFAQKVGASGGASNPAAISHEYHRRQLADFFQAIETGKPPRVDGKEGRKAVEIILAIYRSAETGRSVELKDR